MMKKLDKVPIHNLAEEHSVGLVNYGIRIRGKYTITTVSQNVILNKSFDLLPADALANKKWWKHVHDLQVIRAEWNNKIKMNEEMGYSEKESLNIRTEERKLADIEFLKKNKILLALSPDLMKYLITWAVITMMLSGISGCTLKSDWLKEHACH